MNPSFLLALIEGILGASWLHAGLGKLIGGTFASSLGKTLAMFASKTPHTWFANTVLSSSFVQSELFGQLIVWGEILCGIAMLAHMSAVLTKHALLKQMWVAYAVVIALAGASLMNLNFFFAAGWSSPSTWLLNLLMLAIQLVLIPFVWKK